MMMIATTKMALAFATARVTGKHGVRDGDSNGQSDHKFCAQGTRDDGGTSTRAAVLFSHRIVIRRTLPSQSATLDHVRERFLRCWRIDNLGLTTASFGMIRPPWRIPVWGNDNTGVGFVVERFPPLFLQEGIVRYYDYETEDEEDNNNRGDGGDDANQKEPPTRTGTAMTATSYKRRIVFEYKVLNPGYLTWPVKNHLGTVIFTQSPPRNDDNNSHVNPKDAPAATANVVDGECAMEWIVEWTPLWMPIPYWNKILEWVHWQIISIPANYMAAAYEEGHHHTTNNKENNNNYYHKKAETATSTSTIMTMTPQINQAELVL